MQPHESHENIHVTYSSDRVRFIQTKEGRCEEPPQALRQNKSTMTTLHRHTTETHLCFLFMDNKNSVLLIDL